MSDYRAIAGVSSTLRRLIGDRMDNPVDVTIAPPDVEVVNITGSRVNLYLYQVSENTSLKNQEIPGHGHPGAYGHPPLSLDLYYLVTAYGVSETAPDADLEAQQILGDAMRVLHDFSIITRDLHQDDDPNQPRILDPSLIHEFERIKVTLQPAGLEEFSKIWTALPQANFRRSVAYQVSLVQIESQRSRRMAMPVKTRRIHATLSQRPEIDTVYRSPLSPGEPVGDLRLHLLQEITIEGLNFIAPKTWVRFGELDPIRVTPVSGNTIQINVPDNDYPIDVDHPATRPIPEAQRLQPGPQRVEVLTERPSETVEGGLDKGVVVLDQRVLHSNQAVFMLVPEISLISPASGPATTDLTITGKRLFREGLKSFVLVGDIAIEALPTGQTDTAVQVSLTPLSTKVPPPPPAGEPYLVRIMVNGAQSTEEGMTFELTP